MPPSAVLPLPAADRARRFVTILPKRALVLVEVDRLRPTQSAVGPRTVHYKRNEIERRRADPERLDKYLAKRPVPAIVGPDAGLFITDHHHLASALWQSRIRWTYVAIEKDYSALGWRRFWQRMREDGSVYDRDERGRRLSPARLPMHLSGLRHDLYRDLATFVRRRGGFRKSERPFSEFSWAEHFRAHIPEALVLEDFPEAVRRAIAIAGKRDAAHLPGFYRH